MFGISSHVQMSYYQRRKPKEFIPGKWHPASKRCKLKNVETTVLNKRRRWLYPKS